MSTIELDESRGHVSDAPARPVRTRTAAGRLAAVLAVLAGLVATLTAGNPWPAPLPQAVVPARLGALIFAEGDRLFVADPAQPGQSAQRIAAFRLPGAEPLWRAPVPMRETIGTGTLIGDTLVLAADWWQLPNRAQGPVVAVDAESGAMLWNRQADVETVSTAGDLILFVARTDQTRPGASDSRPGTLQAVDRRSGQARWSLTLPPGTHRSYPGARPELNPGDGPTPDAGPTVVVTWPSGRVEIRDLRSGAVLRAMRLAPPGAGPDARWSGETTGDLFLVRERRSVTAYGLDRLDRRWSVPVDLDREYGPIACGAGLCTYRPQGGLRVWDPDTGQTRWESPGLTDVWRAGDDLVGLVGVGSAYIPLAVLDPDSGRTLDGLGRWDLLSPPPLGARLIGMRSGRDGDAWVAEIDVPTRTVRVLAMLHKVSGDCELSGPALLCRRLDGSIGIWRLPD